MKILLVEDDSEQLEPLYTVLSKSGHVVDGVEDGQIAQQLIFDKEYNLLILDWLLPNTSGIAICQQYRQAGKTAPVLMLRNKSSQLGRGDKSYED